MKVICPVCRNDKHISFDNQFTYEECGYVGEGPVYFYECMKCGTNIEVCIPEEVKADEKHRS